MAGPDQDDSDVEITETGEETAGSPALAPVIHHAGLPSIADDTIHHLDERYVELSRAIGVIVTTVIAAVGLVGGVGIPAVAGATGWATVLLAIGCGAVTILAGYFFHRWPVIEHGYHSYRVNPRGIEIHHGVWFRSVVNVARSRIQHTDVSQGPIERRYGLATLHIHTAGTEQAQVTLPGLAHATALAIRDYLVTGGEDDAV